MVVRFANIVCAADGQGHDRLRTGAWDGGHAFVLCDGAGGASGAAEAAELVSQHLVRVAPNAGASARAFLKESIEYVDGSALLPASAGLTTALVVLVFDGTIQGASVGDSEAWLVTDRDDRVLTENQKRKPLVGSRRAVATAFGPVPMTGTLVLGSDGLFKYCPWDALLAIVRSADLDTIPERLLQASQLPSGKLQDDFSVLVCRESV